MYLIVIKGKIWPLILLLQESSIIKDLFNYQLSNLIFKSSWHGNNFRFQRVRLWEIVLRSAKFIFLSDSIDDYQLIMTKKSYAQAFFNNLNRELFLLPFSAFAVIQNESFSTLDLGTQKRQCYPTLPFIGFQWTVNVLNTLRY